MKEIKFVPIYKGKFNKVAKPSLIKRIVKSITRLTIKRWLKL